MKKTQIYLDDVRTPIDTENWVVVRNYDEFVNAVQTIGLTNISLISLDHDLGSTAMDEYFNNVAPNYTLNYNNIIEKTGYDCAKWLVSEDIDNEQSELPQVVTHSANPIGSANIMGYINNYLMNRRLPQTCGRLMIPHTIQDE